MPSRRRLQGGESELGPNSASIIRTRKILAAVSVAVAAALSAPALASADGGDPRDGDHKGHVLSAVGLTSDQRLVDFMVDRPGKTKSIGKVSGLTTDTKIVGIDFRVQNEALYGVGDKGGVYTLSTGNAEAAKVSQLTVALSGARFGVDVNPGREPAACHQRHWTEPCATTSTTPRPRWSPRSTSR